MLGSVVNNLKLMLFPSSFRPYFSSNSVAIFCGETTCICSSLSMMPKRGNEVATRSIRRLFKVTHPIEQGRVIAKITGVILCRVANVDIF